MYKEKKKPSSQPAEEYKEENHGQTRNVSHIFLKKTSK